MISVTINGEERTFSTPPLIQELLDELEIPSAAVAVELNRTIVPRAEHARRTLEDGDVVEVVTFVGGG